MEIYIVRHGETHWNQLKRFQGSADIELNENGRELARLSGIALKNTHFDIIYSSPLHRAYETAKLFSGGRPIDIIIDERLRELNFGDCEGRLYDDLVKDDSITFKYFFTQPELYVPDKHGETIEHMMERAKSFMQEVIEPLEKSCERVMIVAHGALNKGLMCYIKGYDKSKLWSDQFLKNCSTIIVDYSDGSYKIIDESRLFYKEV